MTSTARGISSASVGGLLLLCVTTVAHAQGAPQIQAVTHLDQPTPEKHVFANLTERPDGKLDDKGECGVLGLAFHPDFARNGLFYTVHAERAKGNPAAPNFIPPGFTAADVNYHNIFTEWHAANPAASTFDGTRRELLRVGHIATTLTHPFGNVEFNPTAKIFANPDDERTEQYVTGRFG